MHQVFISKPNMRAHKLPMCADLTLNLNGVQLTLNRDEVKKKRPEEVTASRE